MFNVIFLSKIQAKELQLEVSDQISIFADKAYRQEGGKLFQAIGNVVINSKKDTLYGENVSYNTETGIAQIYGNVRLINKQVTLYGSSMRYNAKKERVTIENARIITSNFTLVASKLRKYSDRFYIAKNAEFTTCRDCVESWAIFGEEIRLTIDDYAIIKNGLVKVKGANLIYIPWIAIPVKNKRQSGLLFPQFMTIVPEGVGFQQPYFWAIDESKDATISPTFWAKRGNGADLEYRQMFHEKSWLQFNSRTINDLIYEPNDTADLSVSGGQYFRHFTELEMHGQWTNNLTQHLRLVDLGDLDIVTDQSPYAMERISGAEVGLETFIEGRNNFATLGIEGNFNQNLLINDPEKFDDRYVQILPKMYLSTRPYTLLQSSIPMMNNISIGLDSDYTVFRQMEENEETYLRNAARFNSNPYLMWNFITWGPFNLKSKFVLDYQNYSFFNEEEQYYSKRSNILKTEFSFVVDKIFGLAYQEEVPITEEEKKQKYQSSQTSKDLIGDLPQFKESLDKDFKQVTRFSYRHSQEYKLIHHLVTFSDEEGNSQFDDQIQTNFGWFDYTDAERRNESKLGLNTTRLLIPPENTIEFQWNNSLIKKSPKYHNQFADNKYLKDNFTYNKLGHFKISQGVEMQEQDLPVEDRLTRLHLDTLFANGPWRITFKEYYFHQDGRQFFDSGVERKFEIISLLADYNFNSLGDANLRNLKVGTNFRPIDVFGFSILREFDLDADQNIKSIYQMDYMPNNNCWIFSLNYWQTVIDSRVSFNILFNFGDENFSSYRDNYFSFNRLR